MTRDKRANKKIRELGWSLVFNYAKLHVGADQQDDKRSCLGFDLMSISFGLLPGSLAYGIEF
jgi:hypothetical protein